MMNFFCSLNTSVIGVLKILFHDANHEQKTGMNTGKLFIQKDL